MSDFDEVRDITIIGAGPVGLSTAFWAGMREASAFTKRDTPTFTCVACSVERALNALDGTPLNVEVTL